MTGFLNRHPHASSQSVLFYVGSRDNPAQQINLRAIDPERYTIVNEGAGGEVLEEIEESKAFFEVYDGAVYLYQVIYNIMLSFAVFFSDILLKCFLCQLSVGNGLPCHARCSFMIRRKSQTNLALKS